MPEFDCNRCDRSFDSERGLHVHQTKKHHETRMKKMRLIALDLINQGKSSLESLADSLGWDISRAENFLDEMVDLEYLKKTAGKGKDSVYKVTDKGKKEIQALMEDVADSAKKFISSLKDSFEKHLGHTLPDVEFSWKKDKN